MLASIKSVQKIKTQDASLSWVLSVAAFTARAFLKVIASDLCKCTSLADSFIGSTNLEGEIANVAATLPRLEPNASAWEVKAYEDMLDAIVYAGLQFVLWKDGPSRSAIGIRQYEFREVLRR